LRSTWADVPQEPAMAEERSAYHLGFCADPEKEKARLALQIAAAGEPERLALLDAGLATARVVLELGCGPSLMTPLLASWAPQAQIVAFDYDASSLRDSAHRRAPLGDRAPAVCGNMTALPFARGKADCAYLRFLVQHLRDPQGAIDEVARLLAPGGLLALFDGDVGGLVVHPTIPCLDDVLARNETLHRSRGGDRRAGRKLLGYLTQAGLEGVQARPLVAHSGLLGVEGFRATFLEMLINGLEESVVAAAREEFARWTAAKGAFGMMLGVLAWGRAPQPTV
jgi:SAM-dependent methyltransferase